MTNPFMWLASWREIRVSYKYATELLNLCMLYGINYEDFKVMSGNGVRASVSMRCARKDAVLLRSRLGELGILCEVASDGGLLSVLGKIGRRSGLAVGFLLSIALIYLSGRIVWDIRVSGNDTVSEDEVIDALRENGFGIGSRTDKIDINKLENRVSASCENIAWISVNLSGTVANVQIREKKAADKAEAPTNLPSHLVSTFDGQIEELLVYEGWSAVKVGQAVRAGDILVSGKRETEDGKIYYTSASGEVLARVYKEFTVEIPIRYELLEKKGEAYTEKYINFFSKSVKIQKKGRKIPASYDIIENEKELSFSNGKRLPISFKTVSYIPTRAREMTRTYEEATSLAYEELNRLIAINCESDQLLSKTVSANITDTSAVLVCEILCICNIAERAEFIPEETP